MRRETSPLSSFARTWRGEGRDWAYLIAERGVVYKKQGKLLFAVLNQHQRNIPFFASDKKHEVVYYVSLFIRTNTRVDIRDIRIWEYIINILDSIKNTQTSHHPNPQRSSSLIEQQKCLPPPPPPHPVK